MKKFKKFLGLFFVFLLIPAAYSAFTPSFNYANVNAVASASWNFATQKYQIPLLDATSGYGGFVCESGCGGSPSTSSTAGIAPLTTTGTSLLVKNAAGNLYGYDATESTTAGFLAILNVAAVPATSAAIAPLQCVAIPVSGTVHTRQDLPDRYSTGIVLLSTSSCTVYTPLADVIMGAIAQ